MASAETLIAALATVFTGDDTEMDAALIERLIEALEPITAPDVVMVMRGDQTFVATYEGLDGLRAGWEDWLGSFDRVRFEVQGIEEVGDNVLTLGRQVGTTRTGGIELEQPSAAVWKFRDGLLRRVEFHLDRDAARRSAAEQP